MKAWLLALSIVGFGIALPASAKLTPNQIAQLPPAATGPVQFQRDIKPILETSCVKCHGRGKNRGGFKLDTRATLLPGGDSGPVAIPGHSADSLLIELVSGLDPDNVMPQKGSRLTPAQVGLLRAWIDQGMPWDPEISFGRPPALNLIPRTVALPPATEASGEHPIDRLLQSYLKSNNVPMTPLVEDRIYARRVSLDAIGVLPAPEALDAFVADRRADKKERLVRALLSDNVRYAGHWLSFWNDLLRNDYQGTGYIDGGRHQISTWLIACLVTNRPYDQFVAELLHPGVKSDGFVNGIVWRGAVNASQRPEMQAAQNISQVFMGVNLKCASCHDSFINDWSLAEAYSLANVYADAPLEIFRCDKPTGKKAGVAFLYPQLGTIDPAASKDERRRRLAEIMVSRENGRLTRTIVNRLWQRFLGRGLVEPVDDMEQPAWHPDLLDWLAEDLAAHGFDLKRTMTHILTSRAYQRAAVNLDEENRGGYVFTGPAVRRMTAEQFRDALGTLTGAWPSEISRSINRAVLATPETAKVAAPQKANWIWNNRDASTRAPAETLYFHKTLVIDQLPASAWAAVACDNSFTLYVNGANVLSGKTWAEPNIVDLRPHLTVGTNLIAVAAINHLPDDKVRNPQTPIVEQDANPAGFIFCAKLKPTQAGPALEVVSDRSWECARQKENGWEKPGGILIQPEPAIELGPASMAPWQLDAALGAALVMTEAHIDVRASFVSSDRLTAGLGRPNREQVVTTRPSAATTLQAMELTNGDTLNKLLHQGAEKLLAQPSISSPALVAQLYRQALGRKPTPSEESLALELLGQTPKPDAVEDLLWAVTMLPEFQLIY